MEKKDQLKRILGKASKLESNPHLGMAGEFSNMEDKMDEMGGKVDDMGNKMDENNGGIADAISCAAEDLKPEMKRIGSAAEFVTNFLESIKGDPGESPTDEDLLDLIKPLIPEAIPGKDGKDGIDGVNYKLTAKDKKEIAASIEVPVLEKEIIVKEQPIVTNEVKEVAIHETAEEIINKINELPVGSESLIDAKHIKNLPVNNTGGNFYGGNGIKELKAGTGITIDNSNLGYPEISAPGSTTDEKVKYDVNDTAAGYLGAKVAAGTGISLAEGTGGDADKLKITNSAPDQTVSIAAGTNITSVTGTYPSFTINAATQTTDISGKEDTSNKENTTIDTSSTKYPTVNLLKTGLDLKLPLAGGTMTGNLTIGDAKQIVLTAPTADVTSTGISTLSFNSGYTSTAVGDLVYLDSSSTWQKADADAIATAGGMLGIALTVSASAAAVTVALPGSFVRVNAWNWTPGVTLYVSETPGGLATAIPTGADGVVREIGWAVNADTIYFMPNSGNSTVVA